MTTSTAKIQAGAGVKPRGLSLRLSEIVRKNLISYVYPRIRSRDRPFSKRADCKRWDAGEQSSVLRVLPLCQQLRSRSHPKLHLPRRTSCTRLFWQFSFFYSVSEHTRSRMNSRSLRVASSLSTTRSIPTRDSPFRLTLHIASSTFHSPGSTSNCRSSSGRRTYSTCLLDRTTRQCSSHRD